MRLLGNLIHAWKSTISTSLAASGGPLLQPPLAPLSPLPLHYGLPEGPRPAHSCISSAVDYSARFCDASTISRGGPPSTTPEQATVLAGDAHDPARSGLVTSPALCGMESKIITHPTVPGSENHSCAKRLRAPLCTRSAARGPWPARCALSSRELHALVKRATTVQICRLWQRSLSRSAATCL